MELHEFSVTLWKNRIKVEDQTFSLGALSTQVLNLDDHVLARIHHLCAVLLDAVRENILNPRQVPDAFLIAKTQKAVNAVITELRKLPLYNILKMDEGLTFHSLERLWQDKEALERTVQPGTDAYNQMNRYYTHLAEIPDDLLAFKRYMCALVDLCFKDLKKRNAEHYAVAHYLFVSDSKLQRMLAESFRENKILPSYALQAAQAVMVEYITMPNPDNTNECVLAEQLIFHDPASFFFTDFFRGLMVGNAPCRCENCGKFFLLENGYHTRYCNEIAPGEKNRTCRQVGAHKKEARPEGKTPARIEYDKVYSRLKSRKNRGKISLEEWNRQVAYAQEIKEQTENGKLSDREMRELFCKI